MKEAAPDAVEAFAQLMARLDDPFADREAVLASEALDVAALARLTLHWKVAFDEAPGSLVPRFTFAYQQAANALRRERRGLAGNAESDVREAIDDRFLGSPAQPWREEAAQVPLHPEEKVAPRPEPVVHRGVPTDLGSTVPLTSDLTDAPMPFASVAEGTPLSLEQYAAFRAELGVYPDRRDELLAKYRIEDAPAQRRLDETWRKRFALDRASQKRFLELGAIFRDQLLGLPPT